MRQRAPHNPEAAGSSPASATIKTPDFDKESGVFLTFGSKTEWPKKSWGIAAGIVPKYAFSENRKFQTFFGIPFFMLRGISLKNGKNIAVGVSTLHRR